MKLYKKIYILFIILSTFICILPTHALGDESLRPTLVLNYSINPVSFMPGDNGTIDILLQNKAKGEIYVAEKDETFDMGVYLAHANLGGNNEIKVLGNGYSNIGLLGPGNDIKLKFNIKIDQNITEGVHYLYFEVVGGHDFDSINYKIPITVDNINPKLLMSKFPSVVINERSTIDIEIVNTRINDINNIFLIPHADDIVFKPSEVYIKNIMSGDKANATIDFDTSKAKPGMKNITYSLYYNNGNNKHVLNSTHNNLEVINQSEILLTDIELEQQMNKYIIKGNINNIGSNKIKNVVISIDNLSVAHNSYFVGELESDDSSTFEISAPMKNIVGALNIPLKIDFRRTDNTFATIHESLDTNINNQLQDSTDNNGSFSLIAIIAIVIILIGIVGILIYSWKWRR